MNIFFSDDNPVTAAHNLDNLRLNKMIVESCQMLCTALHRHSINDVPYKPAYERHPCTLWVGDSRANYVWLLRHTHALLVEKGHRRRSKTSSEQHKCWPIYEFCRDNALFIPLGDGWHVPPNCTPFGDELPRVEAYRKCLINKWETDTSIPRWSRRGPPEWLTEHYKKEAS